MAGSLCLFMLQKIEQPLSEAKSLSLRHPFAHGIGAGGACVVKRLSRLLCPCPGRVLADLPRER
eukprot:2004905-Amphidinium_carterae.1